MMILLNLKSACVDGALILFISQAVDSACWASYSGVSKVGPGALLHLVCAHDSFPSLRPSGCLEDKILGPNLADSSSASPLSLFSTDRDD